ncbi:MAG: hypothetical protein ABIG84_04340 [archaeon]
MPSERLTESDINRLRGVVGLGTTGNTDYQNSNIPKNAPQDTEKIMPTPVNAPKEKPPLNNIIEPLEPQKKEPAHKQKTQVETELFVKIDEHTEVAKELTDAKIDIKSIADTISLLGKAEKLKAEAIERLEIHLNELDTKLIDVEEKLSVPDGLDIPDEGIDLGLSSDVSNLHKTLERLKDELDHIE